MLRHPLTDSQLWLIMNTPSLVADLDLAQAIGSTTSAVHATRWRLRNQGWTCRVSFGVCLVCQEPFTRQGHKAGARHYHSDCRPLALKQMRPLHDRAKWQRQSPAQQQVILEKAHQHNLERQAETAGRDTNRMRRWTRSEDDAVLDEEAPPDHNWRWSWAEPCMRCEPDAAICSSVAPDNHEQLQEERSLLPGHISRRRSE